MSLERQPSIMNYVVKFFGSFRAVQTTRCEESAPPASSESSSDKKNSNSADVDNEIEMDGLLVEIALRIGIAVVSGYLLTWMTRRMLGGMLPDSAAGDDRGMPAKLVYRRLARILEKRGSLSSDNKAVALPKLSGHELQMAEDILDPDDIENSFADIGGLDRIKQEIYELAVLPLVQPELFSDSKLVQPVKGILLYGKPGTGKTMLAKALAKESEAVFLPLQLSKILNKFWGESNKIIAATFSLAHKLQPAIIFIDELDSFLKNSNSETAYMDSIKAEFLTLWDGVATASQSRVLVLGATNKPQGIDPAILRRMPRAFEVPLPDEDGRLAILKLLFHEERIDESVPRFLPQLARLTVGYSGSDLKEMCKAAAMVPVQERTAEFARRRVMGESNASTGADSLTNMRMRPISAQDLRIGFQKVQRTGAAADEYGRASSAQQGRAIDMNSLNHLAAMLRTLSSLSVNEENGDDIPNVR